MPTVSSASQIILSLTSAQIVKGWPAFTSSVVEFLWRGTMCYFLLNCPVIDHLPGLPNLVYFFIPSIPISLETVCLEHSLHTPPQLPLPSRVSCPGLQAPVAPGRCDWFPSPSTPWTGMVWSINKLPEPWRAFLRYAQKPFLSSNRVWSDVNEQWQQLLFLQTKNLHL